MTLRAGLHACAWTVAGAGVTLHPLMAAAGLVLALPGRFERPLAKHALPLASIALIVLVAGVMAPRPASGVVGGLGMVAVVAIVALSFMRIDGNGRAAVAWGAWAGGLANAGLALAQVLGGANQAVGFAFHPSFLAAHLTLGLGAAGLLAARSASTVARAIMAASAVALLAALAASGSRGGVAGVVGGMAVVFVFWTLRTSPRRAALSWFAIALVAGGLVVGHQLLMGPASRNLLIDSGFEHGSYPWGTSSASTRVEGDAVAKEGANAMLLASAADGWEPLLAYELHVPVDAGTRYAFSYHARPSAGAVAAGVFLRIEALGATGTMLGRWGRDGWADGGEGGAGGRRYLPTEPTGRWRRVAAALPPLPPGATSLRLVFTKDGGAATYGLVDGVQFERGANVTADVAGRAPGLGAFLGPFVPRLQELVANPVRASGGRISMWWFGLRLASQRPVLGYGTGAEEWLVRIQAPRYVANPLLHLHSFYLTLLVEGGSVLLMAVLVWLGRVLGDLVRLAWRGSNAALAASGMVVALLVMSLFDQVLGHAYVLVGMWLLSAVVLSTGEESPSAVGHSPSATSS